MSRPQPSEMDEKTANARKIIRAFRDSDFNLDDNDELVRPITPDRKKLQRSVKKLAEDIYSKETHFIFELIQNAEDNSYSIGQEPKLAFHFLEENPTDTPDSDGCLCVFNNEDGFNEENIKAICDVGFSTKKNEEGYKGYIGEKGIGFKSVFLVSGRPHILSGGYSIYLNKEEHPVAKLGYLIPKWIDEPPSLEANGHYETAILLPLESHEGRSVQAAIKKHLEELAPEVILFLRRLKGISVSGITEDTNFEVNKDDSGAPIVSLLQRDSKRLYWIHKEKVATSGEWTEKEREEIRELACVQSSRRSEQA